MADTTKMPNLQLDVPDVGLRPNQWGDDLRAVFAGDTSMSGGGLDDAVAGVLTKSVAGSSDVTLTSAEAMHHTIILTGALTANINVIVPTFQRNYRFRNDTTGAFTVTIKTSAGTGVEIRQGDHELLSCDGTNVVRSGRGPIVTGDSGGSSNAYTLTPSPALTAYAKGQVFGFIANFANTGAATLNVSSLGAKAIKKIVSGAKADLASDDIISGQPVLLAYDGTDAILLTAGGRKAVEQGKHTIYKDAASMTPNTTNGPSRGTAEQTTNKNMVVTLDFDASTQESAQFTVGFPKSWNAGTITFIPVWTAASGTGGVVWELSAVATGDGDALDAAFGTAQTSTDTLVTAGDAHYGPESSAITIAGSLSGPQRINFRISRKVADASDTLAVDAKLLELFLFITLNAATDA